MQLGRRFGELLETMGEAGSLRNMAGQAMRGQKVQGTINGVARELKPAECCDLASQLETKAGRMLTELVAEVAANMLGLLQEGGSRCRCRSVSQSGVRCVLPRGHGGLHEGPMDFDLMTYPCWPELRQLPPV